MVVIHVRDRTQALCAGCSPRLLVQSASLGSAWGVQAEDLLLAALSVFLCLPCLGPQDHLQALGLARRALRMQQLAVQKEHRASQARGGAHRAGSAGY